MESVWNIVKGLWEIHDDQKRLIVSTLHSAIQVIADSVHKLNQFGFTIHLRYVIKMVSTK